ncbi:MAG: single-stranded DNA-binding protein [Clostridia bacterium]|nr:single-stranded DNA-binding protein [Clostridia bacterium]
MLNVVVLMGRLTADPELKTTPNGVSVTSFSIAVDRSYQKPGEQRQADFINIVAWRSTAEFITRYFRKGSMIAINGSLQSRSYTDKEGNKRTAYEVVADNVSFCGSKAETGSVSRQDIPQSQPVSFSNASAGDFEEISMSDDDLPF